MPRALLSLGSNLGDREHTLRTALHRLDAVATSRVQAVSSWWTTAPAGGPVGQGEFLNAAAVLETQLNPAELLEHTRTIEQLGGRQRLEHWSARTLDIDLLLYDDQIVNLPQLVVPHPRFAFRRFALEPAAEIASDWRHPVIDWTIGRLTDHARQPPLYIALCGADPRLHRWLVEQLLSREPGEWIRDPVISDPGSDAEHAAARRQALAASARSTQMKLLISDFWCDEEHTVSGEYDSSTAAQNPSSNVITPKLLVVVDSRDSSQIRAEEAARLRRAATRQGRGPWLIVDGSAPEQCLEELIGAAAALRADSVRRFSPADEGRE
ncbi:MAG: 2-amino-4-hydroxy-6-hydroxymethyldihydropteridine diphosphokinase [Pirellulales bacterium]